MPNSISPLRLTARTESGQVLGTVVDVSIEPETHSVVAYHIKPHRLLPNVVSTLLIINHSQVVRITDRELIVEDAALRRPTGAPVAATTP